MTYFCLKNVIDVSPSHQNMNITFILLQMPLTKVLAQRGSWSLGTQSDCQMHVMDGLNALNCKLHLHCLSHNVGIQHSRLQMVLIVLNAIPLRQEYSSGENIADLFCFDLKIAEQ